MWIVWKKDLTGDRPRIADGMFKTKREAEQYARYENKWRGIYGFEFTVEESLINVVMK